MTSSQPANPPLPSREDLRQVELDGIKASGPLSEDLEEYWTTITLPDGWESKTKVVRPKSVATSQGKKYPLIVYFFGGGFSVGTPDQITRPARDFAEKFGAVVVCPSYRLTPEVRWPVPMRDGWDIFCYLAEKAEEEFGVTLDGPDGGFVIGGVSAGASVAAVPAAISLFGDGTADLKKPVKPFTGLFLSVPHFLTEEIVPEEYKKIWTSREDNKDAPGITPALLEQVTQALQPDTSSPWFSPFHPLRAAASAPSSVRESYFPVYIQVGHYDILRDDGIVFEKMLASHGFRTKIDVFPEDGHVAVTVMPTPHKSKNPTVMGATMSGMEWLLRGGNAS